MRTALRAVAWAAWAAWTCKEPVGSLLPDFQRLVDRLFERRAPGGKLPGFFFLSRAVADIRREEAGNRLSV